MAIARDSHGEPLADQDLTVEIGILTNISPVDILWEEGHGVKTNSAGLFQIIVGDPTAKRLESSQVPFFSDIDWHRQPMYLRTVINGLEMGTVQLFSVPYSMVSGDLAGSVKKLEVMGDNPTTEDALFEVKRKDGQSMFAVYNQGVRINVPMIDAVKGAKGGFAIGGFDGSKGDPPYNLFSLNKDSVRIYLDKTPDLTKGAKGGFAIGGFDIAGKKGLPIQEYLSVTPDSTRIYVKQSPTKGAKGGFAIGGFDGSKGNTGNFLNLTKDNYFIGHESGSKIPDIAGGLYNSVIGYQAGKKLTTGSFNTFLGFNAGTNNLGGASNVFIGHLSGISNSSGNSNVYIGTNAGRSNNGDYNIAIGDSSGYLMTSGEWNIIIGKYAGYSLSSGRVNVLIGPHAGYSHTTQEYNVIIGPAAGMYLNTIDNNGSYNTFMGINSGHMIRKSTENVLLGTNAGYWLDNGRGNTFLGIDAGRSRDESGEPNYAYRPAVQADYNTILGDKAGYYLTNGDKNVAVGYMAGYNNADGIGNVFLGNMAGFSESSSNKLYIANTSGVPLIYGDFSTGNIGLGTTSVPKRLNVSGDVAVTGDVSAGTVNGMSMGKIYLTAAGNILSTFGTNYTLYWLKGTGEIYIYNTSTTDKCEYWYKTQNGGSTGGGSGQVNASTNSFIISGVSVNHLGIEVHFGSADGQEGWCSVWLQYEAGTLVGHYIKY